MKEPLLIKKCIICGKEIEIRLKRDIERKKYCSRSCSYKDYHKKNPELLKNLDKGRTAEVRKKAAETFSKKAKAGEIIFKGKLHVKPLIVPNLVYSIKNDGKKIYDIEFLPRSKRCNVCLTPISDESKNNLCRKHFNETKKNKVEVTCLNCNKKITKIPSLLNKTNNFCSLECTYEYRKKQPNKKIKAICKNCNKIFYKYPSLLAGKNTFCCPSCSSIYYGKKNRKKCVFYIDGRTPLRKLIKNGSCYDNWRRKVLEKGQNKCEICGETSRLHIHHKTKFSKLYNDFLDKYKHFSPEKDMDKLINLSENYKPFWDVDNGQILCIKCHSKQHPDVFLFKEAI